MHNQLKPAGIAAIAACMASCASYGPVDVSEATYSKQEVAEDLSVFVDFVKDTHPNIEYSADLAEIDALADHVRLSLSDDMTAREAWMTMALMNPVFKDAHIGLRRPRAEIAAFENGGGSLLSANVVINETGVIQFSGAGMESVGIENGDELLSINGIRTDAIIETLTPRMRGNSAALGRFIMELYFPQYFWTAYGGYDHYRVRVKRDGRVRTVTLPSGTIENTQKENPYLYEQLTENIAYMDVPTFDILEKSRFRSFIDDAFAQVNANKVDTLIVDLRKNGGGARDLSDLLMAYLTDEPYSSTSRITARITEENISRIPGSSLGDVVALPFQQTVQPPADLPNRFSGKVYALIGGLTYSQAIVFSSTLQDHKLATIVGAETEGPANQTGQVQSLKLPNTGFEALAPIYIFTRASGDTSSRGVIPDIDIKNDPLDPKASINTLLKMLEK